MAFKSIGTLAGEVLKKAKAARANQVALEFEAVPLSRWEAEEAEPPNAQPGAPGANGNELPVSIAPRTGKRAERPASHEVSGAADCELNGLAGKGGDPHQPGRHTGVKRLADAHKLESPASASLPTMDRSKVIASPTSRLPRRSAIIFDLGMERARRHASTPSGWRALSSLRN